MSKKNNVLKPLSDRVVLKKDKPAEQTAGGIVIPESGQQESEQAQVIAVGPGKRDEEGKRHKPDVKAGDKVLLSKYAGTEVQVDGERYVIVPESDILGIIQNQGSAQSA